MIRKVFRHPLIVLHRRIRTRTPEQPWPFLFSVVDGEIFKNLPPVPKAAKKSRKKRRRVKIQLPDAPF